MESCVVRRKGAKMATTKVVKELTWMLRKRGGEAMAKLDPQASWAPPQNLKDFNDADASRRRLLLQIQPIIVSFTTLRVRFNNPRL